MSLSYRNKIIISLVLLLGVWWLPWWLVALAIFGLILFYPDFYALLFIALLFDLTYSARLAGPLRLTLPVTIFAVILLLLARELHQNVRI